MRKPIAAVILTVSIATPSAQATDFNVEIVHLSNAIYYTPFLVATDPDGTASSLTSQHRFDNPTVQVRIERVD